MSGNEPNASRAQRRERALLGACQAAVASARSQFQGARRSARIDVEPFREDLVAALEEYAATIERSGAPVPQRLRAELDLYRNIRHRR